MASAETLQEEHRGADVERTRSGCCFQPTVDILEVNDELVLRADLPGASGHDIDIQFEDGQLSVRAPVAARQGTATRYLLREYGVGDFYRTFRVSEQIDASRIAAEFKDGVLTLHLPKVEAVKPRKIAVQS